jgi:hypothetical protein
MASMVVMDRRYTPTSGSESCHWFAESKLTIAERFLTNRSFIETVNVPAPRTVSQNEGTRSRIMESTRELAFHAKQVPRREVHAFRAVANDDLLLVHERRLTNVEDHNEYLVEIVDDLNEENAMLRRELAKAERANMQLQVANSDLKLQNEKLLSQRAAMRSLSNRIAAVNEDFKAVAAETFNSSIAPVTEYRALTEHRWNHS